MMGCSGEARDDLTENKQIGRIKTVETKMVAQRGDRAKRRTRLNHFELDLMQYL